MSDIGNVLVGREGRVGGVWIQSQRGGSDMLVHVASVLRANVDAWRDAAKLRALMVIHLHAERLGPYVYDVLPPVVSPHPTVSLFVEHDSAWKSQVSVTSDRQMTITMSFDQLTMMGASSIRDHFAPVWR